MTTPKPETLEEWLENHWILPSHKGTFGIDETSILVDENDKETTSEEFGQAVAAFLEPKIREGERRKTLEWVKEASFDIRYFNTRLGGFDLIGFIDHQLDEWTKKDDWPGKKEGFPKGEGKPDSGVIERILAERERQNAKWGEQNHNAYKWLAILVEEVGEVGKAILELHKDKDGYEKELVEVAAVAVTALESYGRYGVSGKDQQLSKTGQGNR